MFKIRPSIKYQALYKDLYAQYTGARSKGFHVDFKCSFEKACHCQALEMQQFKTEENSAVHAANTKLWCKVGSYLPVERFNMDQSPLPFAHGIQVQHMNRLKKRKKGNRNQRVWAAQPEQGDSKPFRTLNICFRPSGDQPGLAIIFRGKSLRLSAAEKASWD